MTRLEISIFITLRPSLLFYISSIFTPQPIRLSLRKNLLKKEKSPKSVPIQCPNLSGVGKGQTPGPQTCINNVIIVVIPSFPWHSVQNGNKYLLFHFTVMKVFSGNFWNFSLPATVRRLGSVNLTHTHGRKAIRVQQQPCTSARTAGRGSGRRGGSEGAYTLNWAID